MRKAEPRTVGEALELARRLEEKSSRQAKTNQAAVAVEAAHEAARCLILRRFGVSETRQ